MGQYLRPARERPADRRRAEARGFAAATRNLHPTAPLTPVIVHLHRITKRPWSTARDGRAAVALPAPVLVAEPPPLARERDADRPEDRAVYHCHCGYVFEAAVSTSVGCPHCGSAQAW